jgi:hypothetical protein
MRTITNTQHRLRIDHSLSEYRHLTTLQRRGPIPIRHAAISVLQWGSERACGAGVTPVRDELPPRRRQGRSCLATEARGRTLARVVRLGAIATRSPLSHSGILAGLRRLGAKR